MRATKTLISLLSILGVIFLFGFAIGTITTTPDSAFVFIDEEAKLYYAPPCIMEYGFNDENMILFFAFDHELNFKRFSEIKGKGYNPDYECRNIGGFVNEGRSLSGGLLEISGLLPKSISRWNDNGTWNY